MSPLPIGRQGQVFIAPEVSYGTLPTLTSAHSLRHTEVGFVYNPFNRVTSPEKKQSPGPVDRFDRKKTAELGTLVTLLRPSGALNTVPECHALMEAGMGGSTNETLSTTFTGSPTTTTGTVSDAGGLVVGDMIVITRAAAPTKPEVRYLTDVSGNDLTWAPATPQAPAASDVVEGGITYKLTTDLAKSLSIGHYVGSFVRGLLGAGVDSLGLVFDANEEPTITASGPAQTQVRPTDIPATPPAFARVGGNPPSGLEGIMYIDDTELQFKSCELTVTNGILVRNQEFGKNDGTEIYRSARREITVGLETFSDAPATLYDKATAGDNVGFMIQCGYTKGNIVAVYGPRVELVVPEMDDPDEETNWSYEGTMLETADGQNDELTIAVL